jgi:hypothetical protein
MKTRDTTGDIFSQAGIDTGLSLVSESAPMASIIDYSRDDDPSCDCVDLFAALEARS